MTLTLPCVQRAAVLVLLLAGLVLSSGQSCEAPTGPHIDGSSAPWGDPAKGEFAERSGGAS